MPAEWRSIGDDLPDWADDGAAEFRMKDGSIKKGHVWIDVDFNGEDEFPFPWVVWEGKPMSEHADKDCGDCWPWDSATHWRLVK